MKVPLIKDSIADFKKHLKSPFFTSELYKWECLKNFKENWDLTSLDLLDVYNKSFSSKISNRFWVGENYDPKTIMLEFLKLDKEFVRGMFRDLYNDEKDLMMRVNRFIFHCDSLLEELHNSDKRFNAHYHDNYKMISVYLTFNNPQEYTVYDYYPYAAFMQKVGANKRPLENELPKFFTLMKSMYNNFIKKDEELLLLYENIMKENDIIPAGNLLMAHDFYLSQYK